MKKKEGQPNSLINDGKRKTFGGEQAKTKVSATVLLLADRPVSVSFIQQPLLRYDVS